MPLTDYLQQGIERKEYLLKTSLSLVTAILLPSILVFLASVSDEKVLVSSSMILGFIIVLAAASYMISLDLKRLRDILPTRPRRELYVLTGVMFVVALIAPPLSFIKIAALSILESDQESSEFFRNKIRPHLEKI